MAVFVYSQRTTLNTNTTETLKNHTNNRTDNNIRIEIRAYARKPQFKDLPLEKEIVFRNNEKKIILDLGRLIRQTKKEIEKFGGIDVWKDQEKTIFVSAHINKKIDEVCTKLNKGIPSDKKVDLFKKLEIIARKEGVADKLDVGGANSSIKHCIMSNRYFIKQMNKIEKTILADNNITSNKNKTEEKNKTRSIILDKCTREIAYDMLNISGKSIRNIEAQAREKAAEILKKISLEDTL